MVDGGWWMVDGGWRATGAECRLAGDMTMGRRHFAACGRWARVGGRWRLLARAEISRSVGREWRESAQGAAHGATSVGVSTTATRLPRKARGCRDMGAATPGKSSMDSNPEAGCLGVPDLAHRTTRPSGAGGDLKAG
jgi:hypothetical protein